MRIYSQRELEEMDYYDQQQAFFNNCKKPARKENISPQLPKQKKEVCVYCESEAYLYQKWLCRLCFRELNHA